MWKRDERILNEIRERPRTIHQIVEATGISETAVKSWIRKLSDRGHVHHNPDGTYSAAMSPAPSEPFPSLPGGIGGRPYTEWDFRRDALNTLIVQPTESERLHDLVMRLEKYEGDLDLREKAGEDVSVERAFAARRRQDLSAMYGINLGGDAPSRTK